MKTLLIICMATLCLNAAMAQKTQLDTIPHVNGTYGYQAVITVAGAKKDNLYRNAKLYFTDNFKSANAVIQYDDREEGKVVGKGYFETFTKKTLWLTPLIYTWDVYFSCSIECKDGRYRYTIYDINIKQQIYNGAITTITIDEATAKAKKGAYHEVFTNLINQTAAELENTQAAIKKYMENKISMASNDF